MSNLIQGLQFQNNYYKTPFTGGAQANINSVNYQTKGAGYQPTSFIPPTDKMEEASAFLETGAVNPFSGTQRTKGASNEFSSRGLAWDGFSTPVNNGTGELIPDISKRDDSIIGLDLRC